MGAMLVGMVTGFFAMCFCVIWKIIDMTIIFFDARRHRMNIPLWLTSVFLLDLWCLPFYIYARIKLSKNKCLSCKSRIEKNATICPDCGNTVKPFDDSIFAKKFLLTVLIAYVVILVIGTAWTVIVDYL